MHSKYAYERSAYLVMGQRSPVVVSSGPVYRSNYFSINIVMVTDLNAMLM